MIKRMIIMLLLVGLVLGAIFGFKVFESTMIKKYISGMSKQPQTVSTTQANFQTWKGKVQAVGTLRAVRGVDVSSEVNGIIDGLYFESGDQVIAGDLLVKLRMNDELAALKSLKADAHLAQLTYERDLIQLRRKAIPQSTVDADLANLKKTRALVAQQAAVIDKKFIRAPFTGRLGIRQVDLGQYISPGALMVTLQALDPIFFDFYVPQQEIAKIKLDQRVYVTTNLYPDQKFVGKIWALNSKVDPASRNILVRAALDNQDQRLLPGMYGVIEIDIGASEKYITLPQTAITYNPYGNTVFIVKSSAPANEGEKTQLTAEQRFVTVGATRGDQIAILSGVEDGEQVVTAGQIKLQNGTLLNINNEVQPSNDPEPTPEEN